VLIHRLKSQVVQNPAYEAQELSQGTIPNFRGFCKIALGSHSSPKTPDMKKIMLLPLILVLASTSVIAQKSKTQKEPEGFWVIESNVKTPRQSTVYYYNRSSVVIYREDVSGKKLNTNRRKTVRRLNQVLDQSLIAWKNNNSKSNGELVKANTNQE
jgi:hypothetical protein